MSTGVVNTYVVPGYWVTDYVVDIVTPGPAPTPNSVTQTIPMYLYWQYADDLDLQGFVAAHNQMTQNYVDTFNALNLPVYAGNPLIVGPVLDWVAQGIYGIARPVLSSGALKAVGSYDTMPYATNPYNKLTNEGSITYLATTDDVFKRILTWNLYRGDGKIFTIKWLKRRVMRFLTGVNGTDAVGTSGASGVDDTSLVSVTFSANRTVTIDVSRFLATQPSSNIPSILESCVNSGAVQLPFQYTFVVTV